MPDSEKEKEFRFSLSVMELGDSVIQTGEIADGSYKTTYYNHYTRALKAIKEKIEDDLVPEKWWKP